MVPSAMLVSLFVSALAGVTATRKTTNCDGGSLACGSLITYSEDNATEFLNPGRGWYYYMQTLTSAYTPLDRDRLLELRNTDGYTLLYRIFVLDSFRSQPISDATLQKISDDFNVVRSAYFNVIARFAYTIELTDPRNDAPKSVILQHLNQLAPVLADHPDVILTVQHGFIGTWGEGYYTDYFGDEGTVSLQEQEDRQEVYDLIINAVPKCTMVSVRTWAFKEHLTGTSMPVSISDAYTCGNDSVAKNARTAIHDDCFLASENDYGTWTDSAVDRPLISTHSQYTIFGGETCNPDSDRNACPVALHDLAYFHFTYLNNLYHPDVIQRWKDEGCYNTITENLGYRLVLVSSQFPKQASQGEDVSFTITVRNDGYSAPVSEALLEIILLQEGSKYTLTVNGTNIDPRFWIGNGTEHTIMGIARIPNEPEVNGTWNIFLAIVDASLQEVSQYNIIAVNQPPTSAADGLNDLQRNISIFVDCGSGDLNNPTDGQVTFTTTTFNSTATYDCNTGYNLQGVVTRICQVDGTWSDSEPTCQSSGRVAFKATIVPQGIGRGCPPDDVEEAILANITQDILKLLQDNVLPGL